MPKGKKPRGDLTRTLDELEFELKVEDEFENMPTKPKRRVDQTLPDEARTRKCPHCEQNIYQRDNGDLVRHQGPCGLDCIGAQVAVALPFHSEHCSHPTCYRRKATVRGSPRRKRGE